MNRGRRRRGKILRACVGDGCGRSRVQNGRPRVALATGNRAVPGRRPGAGLSNPVAAITDPHSDRYRRLTAESRVAKPRFPRAFSGRSCDRAFDKIKGTHEDLFSPVLPGNSCCNEIIYPRYCVLIIFHEYRQLDFLKIRNTTFSQESS